MTALESGHLIWWLRQRLDEDEAAGRRDFGADSSPGTWLGWVLADVASKRRIVDHCEYILDGGVGATRLLALTVLRELATAWEGAGGFDEALRPT